MKRVVAITVMLVMVTTLFAFSVYADTPVQPLQVITYSDTTTNVRISGTAERLHYNIDSFQVVFMNPPNNYGTACTPVLVSFRFYNASDTPAYVGQPEFELTATTSTGNVNTIIYGYDQISTDLFVAESSYSTAEVGRIGIGASNDFAYYTGFVIPPRTSLYFSCIVYVNASAYGQNNTGATEDVNQVTLSSLNLYTNQISFSADYPYHNQPVDFSDVISAIEDLNSNVSTSSELQQLIALLTYSGVSPSVTLPVGSFIYKNLPSDGGYLSGWLFTRISKAEVTNLDYEYDSSNDNYVAIGTKRVYFDTLFCMSSTYQGNVRTRYYHVLPVLPNNIQNYSYYISEFKSDIYSYYDTYGSSLELYLKVNSDTVRGIIPYAKSYTHITGYVDMELDQSVSFPANSNLTISNIVGNDVSTIDGYYPKDEYTILKDLYLSLVKPNNQDNTSEAQDMNDEIHEQEQVWYDNNSDALEAVGLSNYRFSQSQSSGITTAVTQFQAVWNALGNWTNVYIFILILSISTYIIRHEPTTRVKQYRSSVQAERAERISYYGRKNAESRASASSGSTLKNAIRRRK